jgi:hypothetical protein
MLAGKYGTAFPRSIFAHMHTISCRRGWGLFLVVLEVMYELPAALLEVVPHLVNERPRDHHVHQHASQQRDKHHLGPGVKD